MNQDWNGNKKEHNSGMVTRQENTPTHEVHEITKKKHVHRNKSKRATQTQFDTWSMYQVHW